MSELIGSPSDIYKRMWGMAAWKCHICGSDRPDACISVHTSDISETFGFAAGTIQQNVRYCNDCPSCREAALTKQLIELKGDDHRA
ncbi:hypothetical protein [Leptolyngbya sp. FACHB-16]|uniref:hypothetical protein n=1 Tax=unclassified Leptolyngbya TaxID=2650499 RepID=UPI00168255DE|nr:hypothetical protein [Leptolyngbya sp. FACHB-16]MBD2156291.1 hypothetical protein [Leptolyngbya sp. FACHB-16]